MNRIAVVFKGTFSAVALSLLLSGAALLVSPASAEAQRCAICLYDVGLTCAGLPWGFERCHLGPNSCRLEIPCEEIAHLQFGEDGTATRMASNVPDRSETQLRDRTCDGVLLRARKTEAVTADLPPPSTFRVRGTTTNRQHALVI